MSKRLPTLSKSRYIAGRQCPLRLWYSSYERELATPPDASLQALFDTGHQVGELATQRHPGGVLIEGEYWEREGPLDETRRALASGVSAIFEAAFIHERVFVRVDILARLPEGGWELIEVKSSLNVHEVNERDVALQAWVLRGAGIDVRRAGVLTLNRDYMRGSEGLDLQALFRFHDRTSLTWELADDIASELRAQHAMLAADEPPAMQPGGHCHAPYDCEFFEHCTRDLVQPDSPLTLLPGVGPARAAAYKERGIREVGELPEDERLNPLQERIRQAIATGRTYCSPKLGEAVGGVVYPVHHLDFETVNPAVPRYEGHRPYGAFPFQWSNHVESADGSVEHREYLSAADVDPTREFARSLVEACGTEGSICVYSGYEAQVIRRLAIAVPQLRLQLQALLPRLWDLLPLVREHYYDPAFEGSFSIKKVLPALVPSLSYSDLEIADGRMAGIAYLRSLAVDAPVDVPAEGVPADAPGEGVPAERAHLREQLLRYCGQDSLAMLEIRRALVAKVAED